MKKLLFFIMFCLVFLSKNIVLAYDIDNDEYIYAAGENIGIDINTSVYVVGTFGIEVDGVIYKPWLSANIKEDDEIISYNDKKVTSCEELREYIIENKDNTCEITIKRDNQLISSNIKAILNNNSYTLGLYIKDNIVGVGTMTYYIPRLGLFGSLGHEITNKNTYGGNIYEASVDKIIKSKKNFAGEKIANISKNEIGNVKVQSITGVHGVANNLDLSKMKKLKFAGRDEVKEKEAYIRTSIENNKVEEFKIKIIKCYNQKTKEVKGMKVLITDERLINKTGGIIQGMSGSPIIQDGKLVGALTHVILNNPLEGYGIYLDFMYEDLNINVK